MATTDVSLIEFSAIPLLDPATPIQPGWLLLVEDNVSGAVWRATTLQAKASIAPTLVPSAQSAPTVSLALSASSGLLGAVITLSATATSTTAAIARVDFFDSGIKVGSATAQPYQVTYSPALSGRHTIVAVATDANGTATTSASQFLDISAPVAAPIIVALSPIAPGTVGTAISLVASASIAGGTIIKVEFFDGANKIGEAGTSPYGSAYVPTTAGPHYFTAKATTLTGASAVSPAVTVSIVAAANIVDQPPSCSISATNSTVRLGDSTTLSSIAADADGSIAKLEMFDGSALLASFLSSPYSFLYTPTTTGGHSITAKATDNSGSVTTASLLITVNPVLVYPLAPTNVGGSYVPAGGGYPTAVISVSWLAPAPIPGATVVGYYVYRDGGPVPSGQSATLNFADSYISPGQSHTYTVAAISINNLVGPQSLSSQPVSVPLAAVVPVVAATVPGIPTGAYAQAGAPSLTPSITVFVNAPTPIPGAPTIGYTIFRFTGGVSTLIANNASVPYVDSNNIINGTTYTYTFAAVNSVGAGAQSAQSPPVTPQAPVVAAPVVAPTPTPTPTPTPIPVITVPAPSYHGAVSTNTPTAAQVLALTVESWVYAPRKISFATSGTYPAFAEPASYPLRQSITDFSGLPLALAPAGDIFQSVVSITPAGGVPTQYYLYVHRNAQYDPAFILNF